MCQLAKCERVMHKHELEIPSNWKYWQELNLVVVSQNVISTILADLNLVVRYRIAVCVYVSKKFWQILIWQLLRQSVKLPNLIPCQIIQLYGINFVWGKRL